MFDYFRPNLKNEKEKRKVASLSHKAPAPYVDL